MPLLKSEKYLLIINSQRRFWLSSFMWTRKFRFYREIDFYLNTIFSNIEHLNSFFKFRTRLFLVALKIANNFFWNFKFIIFSKPAYRQFSYLNLIDLKVIFSLFLKNLKLFNLFNDLMINLKSLIFKQLHLATNWVDHKTGNWF